MFTLRLKKVSPLVYSAIGMIAGVLLVGLIFLPKVMQSHENLRDNYGQSLSDMAAKQAVDAAFNHDLVRLHAILNELALLPEIKVTAVYDVENTLLVQSGNPDTTLPSGKSFNSPISLSQSIAGHVSVTLEESQNTAEAAFWFIALITVALLAVSGWLLLYGKALILKSRIPVKRGASKTVFARQASHSDANAVDNVDGPSSSQNDQTQPTEYAYATISITNLGQLVKQLSPNTLRDTLEHCQNIFSDILALYGGSQIDIQKTGFALRFDAPNGEQSEALFRACCSAYLIIHLTKKMQRVPLELSAHIHTDPKATFDMQQHCDRVILHCDIYKQTQLENRLSIVFCEDTPDLLCIDGFVQPYQNLLSNQLSQLIKMH